MDVLQFIKSEHDQLRSSLRRIAMTPTLATKKKLATDLQEQISRHLYIESEYLYPEVAGLFSGAETFIRSSTACHNTLKTAVDDLMGTFDKKPAANKNSLDEKVSNLTAILERHLADEESLLMPKIRELIPTQEREDLGQVFQDLVEPQTPSRDSKRSTKVVMHS